MNESKGKERGTCELKNNFNYCFALADLRRKNVLVRSAAVCLLDVLGCPGVEGFAVLGVAEQETKGEE